MSLFINNQASEVINKNKWRFRGKSWTKQNLDFPIVHWNILKTHFFTIKSKFYVKVYNLFDEICTEGSKKCWFWFYVCQKHLNNNKYSVLERKSHWNNSQYSLICIWIKSNAMSYSKKRSCFDLKALSSDQNMEKSNMKRQESWNQTRCLAWNWIENRFFLPSWKNSDWMCST